MSAAVAAYGLIVGVPGMVAALGIDNAHSSRVARVAAWTLGALAAGAGVVVVA